MFSAITSRPLAIGFVLKLPLAARSICYAGIIIIGSSKN